MARQRRRPSRGNKQRGTATRGPEGIQTWIDGEGLHLLMWGEPTPETLDAFARQFQQQLRSSPLWDELVASHGLLGAERIVQQCRPYVV